MKQSIQDSKSDKYDEENNPYSIDKIKHYLWQEFHDKYNQQYWNKHYDEEWRKYCDSNKLDNKQKAEKLADLFTENEYLRRAKTAVKKLNEERKVSNKNKMFYEEQIIENIQLLNKFYKDKKNPKKVKATNHEEILTLFKESEQQIKTFHKTNIADIKTASNTITDEKILNHIRFAGIVTNMEFSITHAHVHEDIDHEMKKDQMKKHARRFIWAQSLKTEDVMQLPENLQIKYAYYKYFFLEKMKMQCDKVEVLGQEFPSFIRQFNKNVNEFKIKGTDTEKKKKLQAAQKNAIVKIKEKYGNPSDGRDLKAKVKGKLKELNIIEDTNKQEKIRKERDALKKKDEGENRLKEEERKLADAWQRQKEKNRAESIQLLRNANDAEDRRRKLEDKRKVVDQLINDYNEGNEIVRVNDDKNNRKEVENRLNKLIEAVNKARRDYPNDYHNTIYENVPQDRKNVAQFIDEKIEQIYTLLNSGDRKNGANPDANNNQALQIIEDTKKELEILNKYLQGLEEERIRKERQMMLELTIDHDRMLQRKREEEEGRLQQQRITQDFKEQKDKFSPLFDLVIQRLANEHDALIKANALMKAKSNKYNENNRRIEDRAQWIGVLKSKKSDIETEDDLSGKTKFLNARRIILNGLRTWLESDDGGKVEGVPINDDYLQSRLFNDDYWKKHVETHNLFRGKNEWRGRMIDALDPDRIIRKKLNGRDSSSHGASRQTSSQIHQQQTTQPRIDSQNTPSFGDINASVNIFNDYSLSSSGYGSGNENSGFQSQQTNNNQQIQQRPTFPMKKSILSMRIQPQPAFRSDIDYDLNQNNDSLNEHESEGGNRQFQPIQQQPIFHPKGFDSHHRFNQRSISNQPTKKNNLTKKIVQPQMKSSNTNYYSPYLSKSNNKGVANDDYRAHLHSIMLKYTQDAQKKLNRK
jgi:hypothetical protein